MPFQPGTTRRSGFTIQSVSAMTACPSGLRNGARSSCIAKRSSSAYVNSPKTTSSRYRITWSVMTAALHASSRRPSASPSSFARAAAAFTAATKRAFTASASSSPIARSVVPPFDVTCARRMRGFEFGPLASLIVPANVA